MKTQLMIVLAIVTFSADLVWGQEQFPPAKVDYPGFVKLTEEVMGYRAERLVDFDTFKQMAAEQDTIILDTRSESLYGMMHMKGAVHLNFSDFTEEKLRQVVPSKETRILIYCNNNIYGEGRLFPLKKMPLALNIPTYINLYGYGYRNVYELNDLVPVDHHAISMEGTADMRNVNTLK